MHHTQLPYTTLSDKVCSARPLAGSSSVAPVFVADTSLSDSCNCSTITSNSLGDLRFQDCDFTSHFLSNQQFSITAVTTSTGSVAERYAYTAYGQPTFLDASGTPLTTQTSTLKARYLYTGREWDATLGLYHFRASWMSGVAGRFMGRDPIKYIGSGWNLQEFLSGRCLSRLDPDGKLAIQDPDDLSNSNPSFGTPQTSGSTLPQGTSYKCTVGAKIGNFRIGIFLTQGQFSPYTLGGCGYYSWRLDNVLPLATTLVFSGSEGVGVDAKKLEANIQAREYTASCSISGSYNASCGCIKLSEGSSKKSFPLYMPMPVTDGGVPKDCTAWGIFVITIDTTWSLGVCPSWCCPPKSTDGPPGLPQLPPLPK